VVFLFKTRHHDDYKQDWRMRMADVAMATSAAPTIYRALPMGGYMLIDGGVWANNPLMLAITEAMICYDVPRERIKVLSIGCGDDPYYVTRRMVGGGLWDWRKMVGGAMRAQSLAAVNQARLLLAPVNVVRIEPSLTSGPIELDDYRRAVNELFPVVNEAVMANRDRVQAIFLARRSDRFTPVPWLPAVDMRPEADTAEIAPSASGSQTRLEPVSQNFKPVSDKVQENRAGETFYPPETGRRFRPSRGVFRSLDAQNFYRHP
jgi:uncharacterized protein